MGPTDEREQQLLEQLAELEAALEESSDRHRALFLANPVPMWIYDVDTLEFLEVNDAATGHYGYSREEFASMTIADIRPEEDVAALRESVSHVTDGYSGAGIWRHRRADGSIILVHITGHTLRHDGRRAELIMASDVTDVELAEQRAHDVAERLGRVFEDMTDGVLILDVDFRPVFVNPAVVALLERDADELLGRTLWATFPESVGSELERVLRRAMQDRVPIEIEIRWNAPGRSPRWGRVRIHPVPEGVMVLGTDVTEQHLASETATVLVDRLTGIVDVWRTLSDEDRDLDELLDMIPQLTIDLLGAESAVLFLADGDDTLNPRSRAGNVRGLEPFPIHASVSGLAYTNNATLRSADLDADPRAHRLSAPVDARSLVVAPVRGFEGPIGVIAVVDPQPSHFTEADERSLDLLAQALGAVIRRVTTDDALRRSEERFRLVSRATIDAIYDWDLVADTFWWNEGMRALFGWDPDHPPEGRGSWLDLIHPDDRDTYLENVRTFIVSGRGDTRSGRFRFRRSDGSYALLHDRMYVLRGDDGKVTRVVGGLTDVSAQVEAEQRAAQSQRLEAVGQLTGGLAHDFNNLLTVILGNADQLVEELGDQPELQGFAAMTRTAALRGAELSHRLLAFARRQALEPEATDVNELLGNLDGLLRRTLPEHIGLELVRGTGVWPAFVDPAQLEAAVMNLCINARDAMPEGGPITIETGNAWIDEGAAEGLSDLHPGRYVVLAVTDTGTGMAADVLDRVFEPFFTTKAPGAGSGLGLSMVHGFVRQSSGHVTIDSEPGEGTTVRLYLPRALRPSPESDEGSTVHDDHTGTERILLVEDDSLVQRMAARHLVGLGYDVITASSGPEALEILEREAPFDLLFTDVVMPGGMNGRQLAAAVAERQPGLPVLYTSGYTENAMVHQGRLDEGVDLLTKPYRLAELGLKVRAVLDR